MQNIQVSHHRSAKCFKAVLSYGVIRDLVVLQKQSLDKRKTNPNSVCDEIIGADRIQFYYDHTAARKLSEPDSTSGVEHTILQSLSEPAP